jgi:DNA invertase Pin-like site-specific DNA recombinase
MLETHLIKLLTVICCTVTIFKVSDIGVGVMGDYIGFARVSTVDQDLTIQLDKLKELDCREIFCAKQSSVSDHHKRQLEAMLEYLRPGDTVVCTKLDRLGRSLSQVLETLEKIKDRGATFKALDQNIDTSQDDPLSKAMVQLLGMFAELERNMIKERMAEGKKASGNYGGRPSKLSDKQRSEIEDALIAGETKVHLAKKYGVSRATIRNVEIDLDETKEMLMGIKASKQMGEGKS